MRKLRKFICTSILWGFLGAVGLTEAQGRVYEDGGEFIKITIDFHNEKSGLIWAYKCNTCIPMRLLFDQRLLVQKINKEGDDLRLQDLQGKPAVVTWIANTAQALRVLPMEY